MKFTEYAKKYIPKINSAIKSIYDRKLDIVENSFLKDYYSELRDYFLSGGKRIRPLLSIATFNAFSENPDEKIVLPSIGVEFLHNASLIHDDIIDKDDFRRGKPAFYIKEGIPKALLIGHRMLSIGFNIALSHGEEIAKVYVDTWDEVLNGEIKEVDYDSDTVKNGTSEITSKSKIFKEYYNLKKL